MDGPDDKRSPGVRRPRQTLYLGKVPSRARPSGITMDDLRRAIALLFRRKGREELDEKEFVLSASMDLRWFPPREAQRLLQIALEAKLVESREGSIRPTFDVASVEVPRTFTPGPEILQVPTAVQQDVFLGLVDAIVAATKADRRTVVAGINGIQERMDIELEVAALLAARKAGVDVAPFLGPVKARLGIP